MNDERREECKCGHDKETHYKVTERVSKNGKDSVESSRAACLAAFCSCDSYQQQ